MHISKHSLFSRCWNSQDHGRLPVEYISKHSPSHSAYSQDHGRLPAVHVSKHSHKNLHTCWTPWSARGKTGESLKHHESPPKKCVKHCAEITLCQHFLRPPQRNTKVCHCLGCLGLVVRKHGCGPGHTGQTRETTERRCDMMVVVHFCKDSAWSSAAHEAQSDAVLQVRHRACRRRSRWHVDDLRFGRRVWHVRVVFIRDCASCPVGRRLAPSCFVHGQAFVLSRTEQARVALACVWMQLLKLRKTATSQGCKYDVLRAGKKHSTTCGKAVFMAARVASLAWMQAMSQRRIHDSPSLLRFITSS